MPYNYYSFTQALDFYTGTYSAPVNSLTTPIGTVCQPGDVLKMSPGTVFGTGELLNFALDYTLTIESPSSVDWTSALRDTWFQAYMTKVGLSRFITDPIYPTLLAAWTSSMGFEKISGLSIAYVNQDSTSKEVRIGVNCYVDTFFEDWIFTHAPDPHLGPVAADMNGTIKPGPHYISHVGKVTYGGWTDFVWSFGTPYIFSNYTLSGNESLTNGGGNSFKEIKLAASLFDANNNSIVNAHYVVVKNVPANDPTKGLCTYLRSKNEPGFNSSTTAYLGPFCMGDVLNVINDSVYTTRTNTTSSFTWTWYGDNFNVPVTWYLADISNPCTDYKTVPIYDMLFPLRVVSECKYENFN